MNTQIFQTPILFLVFNRPDTTKVVFETIRQIKPAKLYIAADGARTEKDSDIEKCEEVRNIVEQVDWNCDVKYLYRDKNLGCRNAVSSAIDWFFEHEEEGIILEDDCLPGQSFFSFCKTALEAYRDDYRVMHINGVCMDEYIGNKTTTRFTNFISIWGWATWRRAWKLYDINVSFYESLKQQHIIDDLFPENAFLIKPFIQEVIDGKVNTWDIQWALAIHTYFGVALMPPENFVENIGFGTNATHTNDSGTQYYIPVKTLNQTHLNLPTSISINSQTDDRIVRHFNNKPLYPLLKLLSSFKS